MSERRRWSSRGNRNDPAPGRSRCIFLAWLVAAASLGCDGSDANAAPEGGGAAGRHCPRGVKDPPAIVAWPEPQATAGSTPKEIELCLNQEVDRFSLRTQVLTAAEVPVTSCLTREVSMIGRAPVDWARGTVRSIPLDYPEDLPRGMYIEFGFLVVESVAYDSLVVDRTFRLFEVKANGIEPTVLSAVQASAADEAPPATLARCPELPTFGDRPNDELPADDTISRIDVDDWSGVSTLQPLRHEIIDTDENRTRYSSLSFSAWNGGGARIELHMEYQPVSGVPFEGPVQLTLTEADPVHGIWSSRSGHAVVVDRGGEELEVQLPDVVLEKGAMIDEPKVTRALPQGSIAGHVRRRCRAPSWEDDDASWAAPYCNDVRRAAGF
jgi:hypothetical protein